jgi:PhzF family phenazine biosynthesis protein
MSDVPIPLFHVNAFTDQPFSGNPAAVCPLQDWLDDETLRKVAAENNLSETAFFVSRGGQEGQRDGRGVGHYNLRWFTSRCEVVLCGHATLASAYVVMNLLRPGLVEVQFHTLRSGVLRVSRDGEMFAMDVPAMRAKPCERPPERLARGLGLEQLPGVVLEANETYVVVYETEEAIQNIRPDCAQLEQLHPFAVAVTAPGKKSDFVSRYFAPSYGIPEDPVTGSSHCVLAPYWADRLCKSQLYARQISQRGGEIWCQMAGERVILKGGAVLTLRGSLLI